MTVTHINRKGKTYYLHQGMTKTGKSKYFFALRDEGDLVTTIPPGYEIYENPNGQVFLRKIRPQLITDEEVATVEAGMRQHCHLEHYIVDVKKDTILIYTPDQDVGLLAETFEVFPGVQAERAKAALQSVLSYSPMLQFVLVDDEQRLFEKRRYCFLGSIDDWISISGAEPLSELVPTYVRHLGEDSYFDLY
jgi:hypothetical protein